METRKVQLTGGSTYTVSLPKEWADEHDLDPGTPVHLYPHIDGSLVVQESKREREKRTEIRLPVGGLSENALATTVRALYAEGFDRITLSDSGNRAVSRWNPVVDVTRNLIGLEVSEETDTRIVLENLLDTADVSIRQSAIHLQFVALSVHEDAIRAFLDGDADAAEQVLQRRDEIDRLARMIDRHFQRSLTDFEEIDRLGIDRPELFEYETVTRKLCGVAACAERIAKIAVRVDETVEDGATEEVARLSNETRATVETAGSVLLGGGDLETAYDALDARDAVIEDIAALECELDAIDTRSGSALIRVLDCLDRTAHCGGDIAETGIRSTARRGELCERTRR